MADYSTDTSKIGDRQALRVIERRLEDSCGEHDFIAARVVVGVDGLGRHGPFRPVHRIVFGPEHIILVSLFNGQDIVHIEAAVLGRCQLQAVPVLGPLAGITHLHHDGGQFLSCL